MEDHQAPVADKPARRPPWNKGKLVGAKPPLRPSHVWSIRTKLQMEGRKRDLALFNLAIDSKLRGCDVVAVRVDDVAPSGYAMDRATIRQRKTGRPVRFELTDQTRMAIDEYLRLTGRKPGQFLFAGRGDRNAWPDHPAICPSRAGVGGEHRSRSREVRHALPAPHEGSADLPANWEPARGSAFARPFEDRKHRSLSRHRGRRWSGSYHWSQRRAGTGNPRRRSVRARCSQFCSQVAHRGRFELPTPKFVVWCSIQLSYRCLPRPAGPAPL